MQWHYIQISHERDHWQMLENWIVTLGVTRKIAQQELFLSPLLVCLVPVIQFSLFMLSFLTLPGLWMEPTTVLVVITNLFVNIPQKLSLNGLSATSSGWYLKLIRAKKIKPLIYIDIFIAFSFINANTCD